MDDPVMAHWADIVKRSDSQWADADKESELLLVRIKERVAELERRRRARDFFLGYARDPVWFFHKCLDSQARDLQVRVTQARAHTCMAALTQGTTLHTHTQVIASGLGEASVETAVNRSEFYDKPWVLDVSVHSSTLLLG